MIYSFNLASKLTKHIIVNNFKKNDKFAYVLMLEPLFKCNLSCSGCGRIIEYKNYMSEMLSVEQCLDAALQAKAPVVSITGGEPLLHPQIKEIISVLIKNKFFVYLCTNGLKLYEFIDEIKPDKRLSIVVHLDGLEGTHSKITRNNLVFKKALDGIKKAAKLNFTVRTNTTIYKDTDINEILSFFKMVTNYGVHSIMVSPGFYYERVENNIFLEKEEVNKTFYKLYNSLNGVKIYNTPFYWEFLSGNRNLKCTPWANPTFNVAGWKSPCYLITDTHFPTYKDLITQTNWDNYGPDKDLRCKNCMVHCGFEASAIKSIKSLKDIYKALKWSFLGKKP